MSSLLQGQGGKGGERGFGVVVVHNHCLIFILFGFYPTAGMGSEGEEQEGCQQK